MTESTLVVDDACFNVVLVGQGQRMNVRGATYKGPSSAGIARRFAPFMQRHTRA